MKSPFSSDLIISDKKQNRKKEHDKHMSDLPSRKSKRLKSKNDHEDSALDTVDFNSTEPRKVVDYSLLGPPPAESRNNDQEVICLCSPCSLFPVVVNW